MNRLAMQVISTIRTIRKLIGELNKFFDEFVRMLGKISGLFLIGTVILTGKIPLELLAVVILMNTLPHLAAYLTIKPPLGGF